MSQVSIQQGTAVNCVIYNTVLNQLVYVHSIIAEVSTCIYVQPKQLKSVTQVAIVGQSSSHSFDPVT